MYKMRSIDLEATVDVSQWKGYASMASSPKKGDNLPSCMKMYQKNDLS